MDMIRAWKDPEYRSSLSAGELRALPDNPAGPASLRALTDAELGGVAAAGTQKVHSFGCCHPTIGTSALGTNGIFCVITCL